MMNYAFHYPQKLFWVFKSNEPSHFPPTFPRSEERRFTFCPDKPVATFFLRLQPVETFFPRLNRLKRFFPNLNPLETFFAASQTG
jgi:hypothetical protein